MKITIMSEEKLSIRQQYLLTMNPATLKMSDHIGETIGVKCWAYFEDTNARGEEQTILAIMDKEEKVYATNSKTFSTDFDRMIDLFTGNDQKVEAIKIMSGMSKNNREFITCTLG